MRQRSIFSALAALVLSGHLPAWSQALDLKDALREVVTSHPTVRSQRSLLESAQTDVSTARQQFYPTPSASIEQVGAGAGDAQYRGSAVVQTYRLQQPLWTGGRLTASLNRAQALEQASQAGVADAALQLALRTVQAWSEWHAATLKMAAVDESVRTHQRLTEQVQRRVDEGASAPADLVLSQGRLAQTTATQQSIASQVRSARQRLSQLMGAPVAPDATPQEGLDFAPQDLAALEEQALAQAPALQRLAAQQQAQEAEIRERRADLQPEVFVRLEHQRSDYSNSTMASGSASRIFVGLSTRLGAGRSTATQLASLRQRADATLTEAEAARRNLLEQVQTDHEQWRSLARRIPDLEQALQATRKTAEAWDRQFLAGRKTWTEVMNTARELMQAELELIDAQASQVQHKWRLAILAQGVHQVLRAPAAPPRAAGS